MAPNISAGAYRRKKILICRSSRALLFGGAYVRKTPVLLYNSNTVMHNRVFTFRAFVFEVVFCFVFWNLRVVVNGNTTRKTKVKNKFIAFSRSQETYCQIEQQNNVSGIFLLPSLTTFQTFFDEERRKRVWENSERLYYFLKSLFVPCVLRDSPARLKLYSGNSMQIFFIN